MTEHKNIKPFAASFLIVLGIFIGKYLDFGQMDSTQGISMYHPQTKFNQLVNEVKNNYVDDVDIDSLLDKTMLRLLEELDPHSTYISVDEMQSVSENMQGNFDGIGIEYQIYNDTLVVVNAIMDGPSEKVGVQAGDRIIRVDTIPVAGVGLKNSDVVKKLRGDRGTEVEVEILRYGVAKPIIFTIVRDKIPLYSMDVAYMINDQVGYIKVNRFSATTYEEFEAGLQELKKEGARKLILDLRGNPGGYLNAATSMVDEFLEDGKMIVYTAGKSRPKREYTSSSKGIFEKGNVVVLIDESSASASEIVAGAIQDNDRGTIVGRRTFGKGLVQEQWEMYDGSALRLTTSRYYTPTGRSIQKSYANGIDAYRHESYTRYDNGELYNVDSVKVVDSLRFTTPKGKVVYGGGGIMPDIFVPLDTLGRSVWLYDILAKNIINDVSFTYADKHRNELKENYQPTSFASEFKVSDDLFDDLLALAESKGIPENLADIHYSKDFVEKRLKSLISRKLWGNDGFYRVLNQSDKDVLKAMELLQKATD